MPKSIVNLSLPEVILHAKPEGDLEKELYLEIYGGRQQAGSGIAVDMFQGQGPAFRWMRSSA